MKEMTDFKVSFGRLVRSHREQKGWTQIQLAKAVYADEEKTSRVSDVERGRYDPQAATVADYRDALSIPLAEIEQLRSTPHDPQLFEEYERLTIQHISLSVVSCLHNRLFELAHEWEELQNKAQALGEAGDIEQGSQVFMASARKLGAIVDLYKSHTHIYSKEVQTEINALVETAQAESDSEDGFVLLISAIQKIHAETEIVLSSLRNQTTPA